MTWFLAVAPPVFFDSPAAQRGSSPCHFGCLGKVYLNGWEKRPKGCRIVLRGIAGCC